MKGRVILEHGWLCGSVAHPPLASKGTETGVLRAKAQADDTGVVYIYEIGMVVSVRYGNKVRKGCEQVEYIEKGTLAVRKGCE